MKFLKLGLRLWISIASIFSFFVGWIMIGHAPKPAQPKTPSNTNTTVISMPTLEPLPPLNSDNGSSVQNNQPFFFDSQSQPQPQPFIRRKPLFSTGGS